MSRIKGQPQPTAKFSFNNLNSEDEVSHKNPRLVGVNHTDDRFGNANSAIHLFGNEDSYINLGNYPALKPKWGSVSLWVKLEGIIYAGNGILVNPILITKNKNGKDFYEAYTLYYSLESKSIGVLFSQDSLKQVWISSLKKVEPFQWYHLVFTYDSSHASFYVDGQLQKKFRKKFEVVFQPGDSVLLGVTASEKNNRIMCGVVDDIAFYDKALTDKQVLQLYTAPNPNKNKIIFYRVLIVLAILAGLWLIYLFIRYRFNQLLKKEKRLLELSSKMLENELRINRALMNPHFMFNSLNTLHNYILNNNVDKASDYLIKFSKLIRKILDSNMSETISLELEIELIQRYLEIEGLRFKEHIRHTIEIDPSIIPSTIIIPIMMVQPFIENSVWHGMRDKAGDKLISICFWLQGEKYIKCVIEDNGTGRKMRAVVPSEKKSLATNFVLQRLALLNKIHNLKSSLVITDKPNGQGTIVTLVLPILNR